MNNYKAKKNLHRSQQEIVLSIIIPFYNEYDVLSSLLLSLNNTFSKEMCDKYKIKKINFILIDDGSSDDSVELIYSKMNEFSNLKVICLSRNFGHQAAINAGLSTITNEDVIAIMDADLQDPPELIFKMISKWREGFEVVYAERNKRKENIILVFFYWLFYRIYKILSPIDVAVDSGDFCLVSLRIVKEINNLPESVKFIRGLRSWVGFKQTGVSYNRPKREAGKTKYDFSRLYRLATDGITSMSLRPLQLMQFFSTLYIVFSILFICWLTFKILVINQNNSTFQLDILMLLFLLTNSIIFFCLHILGAYVGRTHVQVKERPGFIISEIIEK